MKGKTAFAALGLFVSAGAMADDTAAIASGGINLYQTSSKGISLVKGSPFVPSTPIKGNPAAGPCGSTPETTPILLQETQDHSTVYALYAPRQTQETLVKYKVTSTGLTEQASGVAASFTTMGNHHDSPHTTALGPQNSLIIYYSPGASVYVMAAALFNSSLHPIVEATGYEDIDGTIMNLTSLQVDPSGKGYYVCHTGSGIVRTSVSVYLFGSSAGDVLTNTSETYPASTLVSRSTDATTVSAFCPD